MKNGTDTPAWEPRTLREKRFVKLVQQTAKAEAVMRRSFKRWEKLHDKLVRLEKALDRETLARGHSVGGEIDLREFVSRVMASDRDDSPSTIP